MYNNMSVFSESWCYIEIMHATHSSGVLTGKFLCGDGMERYGNIAVWNKNAKGGNGSETQGA